MKKTLKEKGISVSTRPLTEEESEVLSSILNKKEYLPESINWSNTLSAPLI